MNTIIKKLNNGELLTDNEMFRFNAIINKPMAQCVSHSGKVKSTIKKNKSVILDFKENTYNNGENNG